tara:strand:- start:36 stop:224 length:189 start_codon:yes stop_codon:yes gene_type:complete
MYIPMSTKGKMDDANMQTQYTNLSIAICATTLNSWGYNALLTGKLGAQRVIFRVQQLFTPLL